MKHPPPDDENEKRSFGVHAPGPLTTDKLKCLPQHTGSQTPLSCPPLILAQRTDSDKAWSFSPFLPAGSVNAPGDYIPTDSPGQIELNICTMTLAEIDAEIERERERFRNADKSENDDGFLYSFLRLLCLYEWHSLARRGAAR